MSADKLWTVISGIEYQLNILKDKIKTFDEESNQSVDEAYQRGLEDGKWKAEDGCTGCMWEGNPYDACEQCCNAYKNLWTAKQTDDEIKVGDEVETQNGTIFVVTKVTADNLLVGFTNDGSNCIFKVDRVVKTGRHFDISSILKEMQS